MPEKRPWWDAPGEFLYAWDLAREQALFLALEREALHRSGFLDRRIAGGTVRPRAAPMAEVLAAAGRSAPNLRGFIFHTAFCCSTLLARSFDLPGRILSLREPATLLQLADLARGLASSRYGTDELIGPTLDLISRPFADDEAALIKPTNLVNNLIGPLLDAQPSARAIVLYDELEAFLLSVLKRPRESESGIRHFLDRLLRDPPGAEFRNTPTAGLPEAAALAWHLQIRQAQAWLAGPHGNRLRTLRTTDLIGRPRPCLAAVSNWLGLGLDAAACQSIAEGPTWRSHAKHPELAYAPERRQEEQSRARRLLAAPLSRAVAFAHSIGCEPRAQFPSSTRLSIE